ncbi:hypothetical protein ACFQ0T_38510 [Kitasatospora gansuensis]
MAFRYLPADPALADAVNRELPVAVQLRGRAFVTGALLQGREMLRACLLNAATTEADLDLLLSEVRSAGRELTERPTGS